MSFKKIIIGISVVTVSFLALFFLYRAVAASDEATYQQMVKTYPYLSKRILKENENDLLLNFVELRKKLRTAVASYGDSFAVFFEYLPTGMTIGVNEKKDFDLASLLKVPYVMAYYAQQEQEGLSVNPTVTIEEGDLDNQFGELWQRGFGARITLEEAVKLALVYSDDTAIRVLKRRVSQQAYEQVYEGLDIELVQERGDLPKMSAKSYTSILKALYFSSILTKVHSQEILALLAQTPFDDKLVSGVPKGIPVAHKIGVINEDVYSDCGAIYEPQRPYLLCMIFQTTEDVARVRMKEISSMVYEYVHGVK